MRILVVDEEIPFPLNSGKRIRTFNLLKHLAKKHEIVFICRQHEGSDSASPKSLEAAGIKTIVVPHLIRKKSGLPFYYALFANLFSQYPYSVSSHYSKILIDKINQLIHEKPFDLIHCEWTPYAINLMHLFPCHAVVDAHNVEADIWRRNYEVEKNTVKKTYIYFQWKKMLRFEQKVFPLFTRAIAVSAPDKSVIANWMPAEKIHVIDNGVDIEYFAPSQIPQTPNSLIFTGSMDWRPNVDCILYFLDDIWPLVLTKYPDATLTVAGRNPMQNLVDRVSNSPAVTLTGTVEDVRPYMDKASVYIVPLRIGGGSRLKILEAMSMKKPVVSTTVGAEGLDVTTDGNILLADTPRDFSAAIIRLFKDSALRNKLAENGRTLVENHYQWKILAGRLEKAWAASIEETGLRN
jgi:sugar transferase (PEP-CTERM/EpsH1 system associated)